MQPAGGLLGRRTPNVWRGRRWRLEKPRRRRLVTKQRFDLLPQDVVAIARLLQERTALLRRAFEHWVIEI
jgi:hypothetical protein